jgi:hypothetical protein
MVAVSAPGERAHTSSRVRVDAAALAAWAALILAGYALLEPLNHAGRQILIDAPPIHGEFDWAPTWRLVAPITVGGLIVLAVDRIVRARGALLLSLSAGAAAAWAVTLALVDGAVGLTAPVLMNHEYIHDVPAVGSIGSFLPHFTDRIAEYGVHVQGHPPGMVLALWSLDRVGLDGASWAAFLFIAGGVAAVPAALSAAREVAGPDMARRAAPFVAVAPVAIWVASTADALYAGVGAWAVALVVLATGRRGTTRDASAMAGGVLFGILAFLSYGLVLLAIVPITVAASRRQLRPIVLAAVGATPIFLAFAAAGFSWLDGLGATTARYFAGVGSRRPYPEFLVANLAALAVALGPAAFPALARLRNRGLWLLVGAALAAVALADLSGMSKGEVERIWVPFTPWILLAGAAFASPRSRRVYLTLQVAAALLVATWIATPW